ncbi:hypothetical protein YDYSG_58360 [Paenibacillus tyrfis]|nr:hypothetical protein YDYSG_58360 [Paenibacillus tyrfis]
MPRLRGLPDSKLYTIGKSGDFPKLEKPRRGKVNRGLNKGEAMNALARAIFFGKHGELRERPLQDQLQRPGALNILI